MSSARTWFWPWSSVTASCSRMRSAALSLWRTSSSSSPSRSSFSPSCLRFRFSSLPRSSSAHLRLKIFAAFWRSLFCLSSSSRFCCMSFCRSCFPRSRREVTKPCTGWSPVPELRA
eukprot:CAMPEP_0117548440 /NCGR_PEP_ID=MMETSP0784-20121206/47650_1 /TAXON_ID=39447 /ORGANISM="" /LENGTH=115 /DNA_ID=CAMNT_0005345395 /DNA_START=619 /DNA_END=966 /DNA_ORIENTATION=-